MSHAHTHTPHMSMSARRAIALCPHQDLNLGCHGHNATSWPLDDEDLQQGSARMGIHQQQTALVGLPPLIAGRSTLLGQAWVSLCHSRWFSTAMIQAACHIHMLRSLDYLLLDTRYCHERSVWDVWDSMHSIPGSGFHGRGQLSGCDDAGETNCEAFSHYKSQNKTTFNYLIFNENLSI